MCFTYACWFGVSGLAALGHTYESDDAIRRCCRFVTSKQRADGGWGESYLSCQDKVRRYGGRTFMCVYQLSCFTVCTAGTLT